MACCSCTERFARVTPPFIAGHSVRQTEAGCEFDIDAGGLGQDVARECQLTWAGRCSTPRGTGPIVPMGVMPGRVSACRAAPIQHVRPQRRGFSGHFFKQNAELSNDS